ncbi:MAG: acylphosphatase [Candidatus Eisenbacteria bacterium]|jgi:acylphosphatase|nr:acylphosphatase [Candidatus Eisenbacteria bacterium]
MVERRRIIVRGRVQGVGFRWFAFRRARSLGLAGWVRNDDDGSVQIEAQGESEALAALESQLWEGSRLSHVQLVEWQEIPVQAESDEFRVVF